MSEKDYLWLHLRDLPYFRAMLRAVEARFYQDYELPEPILDVGCGDGHFASVAFEYPLDVGLDPGGSIQKAARYGGYRSLVQADGGDMPFPDDHFGSAISNSVLEHIPHVRKVLAQTARVLKPGAPFLFSVPNPGYLAELSIPFLLERLKLNSLGGAYREWFRRMSRVHHLENPRVWERWLEQVGFQLLESWCYFPPSSMHMLEWGHYFGAPTLVPYALSGKWILVSSRWNLALTERLVRPFTRARPDPRGTFTFYIARKFTSTRAGRE